MSLGDLDMYEEVGEEFGMSGSLNLFQITCASAPGDCLDPGHRCRVGEGAM